MPPKKSAPKPSTKPNDIDSLFAGIENDISKDSSSGKPRTSTSLAPDDDEKALLAEIEGLTAEHRAPSRPVTPRVGGGTPVPRASGELRRQVVTGKTAAPVKKTEEEESEEDDDDDDEDDDDDDEEEEEDEKKVPVKGPLKKKVEAAPQNQQQQGGGGGWWGGIWNTASTAVSAAQSTAQTVYKEIQASEEAQRWTQQVKGSLEGVKELSGELQKRAIPTFTSILQHIAPPISQHERLHIHTTHDLQNYPSLDPLIHQVFARVMQQVEGGDLLVIQRGSESTSKQNTLNTSTWNGGPWWRDERKRELGVVKGLEAGIKLAKATADGYSGEYAQRSPVQEKAFEDPENPVRKSDIFLAVQAVNFASPWTSVLLKAAAAATDNEDDGEDAEEAEEVLGFVVHLYDPKHGLQFTTMSQTCPAKWGDWMDAEFEELPEDVQMGLANGAVDPREWIAEWMEETLLLAVGIIAQSYVSKRMGVGEGLGKGKEVAGRTEVNVGEEARVL